MQWKAKYQKTQTDLHYKLQDTRRFYDTLLDDLISGPELPLCKVIGALKDVLSELQNEL